MDELNNTHGQEEFLKVLLNLYNERQYKVILDNWRTLGENERQEILYRAYKDNVKMIIGPRHFEDFAFDKQVLVDGMQKYADRLNLNIGEVGEIFWGFKGKRYESTNKDEAFIERTFATYARLREYSELVEKYSHMDFASILNQNRAILRCDANRTESRINFLLEQNRGEVPDKALMSRELSMVNWKFNLKYQKEIEQKLFLLEPGSIAYTTLASKTDDVPDYAYDKFLELALRVIYGDEKLIKLIQNERRKAFLEKQPSVDFEVNDPQTVEKPVETISDKEETEDEIDVKTLLFEGALPAEEGMRDFGGNGARGGVSVPSARESLDENKIKEFLKELKTLGINCDGYIESEAGFKAVGQENVRYYVLRVKDYLILEPIGQVGNGTYVIKNIEDKEELKELITTNSKPDLVRKGVAIMLKHDRTEEKEYIYSAQRLANIATIIEEFSREERPTVSFAEVKKQITELVPKEESPQAAEYIWKLGISQKERLAKKIVELEGKLSVKTRRKKVQSNDSTEEAGFDD